MKISRILMCICSVLLIPLSVSTAAIRVDSLKSNLDNDVYIDNGETLFISGNGFTGNRINTCVIRQFRNKANIRDTAPLDSLFEFRGGGTDSLYGWVIIGAIPLNDKIDSVRIGISDNDLNSGWTPYQKVDDVPPITDAFSADSTGDDADSIELFWFGGTDNGLFEGVAVACTIKYAEYIINSEKRWDSLYTFDLPCPEPAPIGYSPHYFYCNMWDLDTSDLFYAIKFVDNMGNISPLAWTTQKVRTKPVSLSSFTAVMHYGTVQLAWRTESETDNAAWRLERSTNPDGSPGEVVYQARKSSDTYTTNFPTEYSYNDVGLSDDVTYYYTLYDISLEGNETRHGPVSTDGISIFNNRIIDEPLILSAIEPNPVRYRAGLSFQINSRAFSNGASGHVAIDISSLDNRHSFPVLDAVLGVGEYCNVNLDRSGAEPGIYIIRLSTDTHSVSRRFMVVGN